MAGSSTLGTGRAGAGHVQRWQQVSPRSGSSESGREQPVVSGLGLSPTSSSSDTSTRDVAESSAVAAEADAVGRVPVQDRLVWEQPHLSRKKKWRRRKAEQRKAAAAAAAAAAERRSVSPEWRGRCFNCGRPGHRKKDCTFDPLCFRCSQAGHETKDCKRPGSPEVEEEELRRQALARRGPLAPPAPHPNLLRSPPRQSMPTLAHREAGRGTSRRQDMLVGLT